mgnify:CR=1 FL=1
MTWFRVGGAGIPAPLKNAMNAVLNKKFGTTGQNYPPKQWPDDVNLLGPLPEGTASGPIANFSDGADEVPIKNWLVTLPASLDGYTSVNGTKNTGTGTLETQYTASLGRTIYGGTADIVNGVGTDYGLWVNMSDIAWTEDTNRAGVFYGSVSGRKTATADDPSNVLGCTCYDVNNVNVTTSIDNYISGARSYGGNTIFFRDSSMTGYTRAQVQEALQGEKVCVISATPETFTFTPITPTPETALGTNNFWADEGDSTVVYRRDIDLALQAVSSSRGLMMASRPVTQLVGEESDPDQVNELVEDDENEIREQLNEVVENDETEQEGEDDAR